MSLLAELRPADLISKPYLLTQIALHKRPEGYGGKGDKWATAVVSLAIRYECMSVLDYGCGQGSLGKMLRTEQRLSRVAEYDPAIPGKDGKPSFADLVVCTDVLEHVEPDRLTTVLAHLRILARRVVFFVVATRPSNKTLLDGRNAHLILENGDWWAARVSEAGFTIEPEAPASPLLKVSREWVAVCVP